MFDLGFWELAVIFVVSLLVLGPERLPRVAQQLGQWAGKARHLARTLNAQMQQELNSIDPRRIMDPPPAPPASPPAAYSRPGVDDLKPRATGGSEPATGPDNGATPGGPGQAS